MVAGDSASAASVQQQVDRARDHLTLLSSFCDVISPKLRSNLTALLDAIFDNAGRIALTQGSPDTAALDKLHGELILQIFSEQSLVERPGNQTRQLEEYIVRGLAVSEHPFMGCASHTPFADLPAAIVHSMERDLGCLFELARSDISGWLKDLGVAIASEPLEEAQKRIERGRETQDQEPWDLATVYDELIGLFAQADDWASLMAPLAQLAFSHGVGQFQGAPAFRTKDSAAGLILKPISDFAAFDSGWLEGNRRRIDVVEENTRNFIDGFAAHNTLIYGPRGCGKSSLIRGLITKYYERGLRGLEVGERLYGRFDEIFEIVRRQSQFFIAVLDNLSWDPHDPSFRHLGTALDGGLERVPENLIFYATSNYKDLVDRDGKHPTIPPPLQVDGVAAPNPALARYDSQQFERLDSARAVDDRFGLRVFMDLPVKSEYEQMVLSYARRAGFEVDDTQLLANFNIWCRRHGHDLIGGRTARDFVRACYPMYSRSAPSRPAAPADTI